MLPQLSVAPSTSWSETMSAIGLRHPLDQARRVEDAVRADAVVVRVFQMQDAQRGPSRLGAAPWSVWAACELPRRRLTSRTGRTATLESFRRDVIRDRASDVGPSSVHSDEPASTRVCATLLGRRRRPGRAGVTSKVTFVPALLSRPPASSRHATSRSPRCRSPRLRRGGACSRSLRFRSTTSSPGRRRSIARRDRAAAS